MRLFIDTGFYVAYMNKRDVNHTRAVDLMKQILAGEHMGYTSDYVFDEAVTVALIRTGRADMAEKVGSLILEGEKSTLFSMLFMDESTFNEAWKLYKTHAERGLSFTDCVSLTLMESHGLEAILSFDRDFDGLAPRIL